MLVKTSRHLAAIYVDASGTTCINKEFNRAMNYCIASQSDPIPAVDNIKLEDVFAQHHCLGKIDAYSVHNLVTLHGSTGFFTLPAMHTILISHHSGEPMKLWKQHFTNPISTHEQRHLRLVSTIGNIPIIVVNCIHL